jgi:hypothetical protein
VLGPLVGGSAAPADVRAPAASAMSLTRAACFLTSSERCSSGSHVSRSSP